MKRYLINILLVLTACAPAAMAQSNLQVSRTQDRTFVTMDFVLDTLNVPSNRYRAFTPVIKSKDGTQQQRLKTLIVSGRRQNIVFQRDGIDPLYAANCVNIRRMNGQPQRYAYSDAVQTEPWFRNADIYMESDPAAAATS